MEETITLLTEYLQTDFSAFLSVILGTLTGSITLTGIGSVLIGIISGFVKNRLSIKSATLSLLKNYDTKLENYQNKMQADFNNLENKLINKINDNFNTTKELRLKIYNSIVAENERIFEKVEDIAKVIEEQEQEQETIIEEKVIEEIKQDNFIIR